MIPIVKLLVRSEAEAEAWRVAREIVALFAAPQRPRTGVKGAEDPQRRPSA